MFRKFTLKEANALLPEIIRLTRDTIDELEATRARMERDVVWHGKEVEQSFHEEVSRILERWAESVRRLGVLPKGYFTCDFVSPNPAIYFCWTFGEKEITNMHKITETFRDRVPIRHPELEGFDISFN